MYWTVLVSTFRTVYFTLFRRIGMGCHDGEKIQGFWLNVYLGHPYSKTGFQPTDTIYRLVWYGTQEKNKLFWEKYWFWEEPVWSRRFEQYTLVLFMRMLNYWCWGFNDLSTGFVTTVKIMQALPSHFVLWFYEMKKSFKRGKDIILYALVTLLFQ